MLKKKWLSVLVGAMCSTSVLAGSQISIQYFRGGNDFDNWGIYTWNGTTHGKMAWDDASVMPATVKATRALFNFELAEDSDSMQFLIRDDSTGGKDAGDKLIKGATDGDHYCMFENSNRMVKASAANGVCDQRAHWLTPELLVWPYREAADEYLLVSSTQGNISVTDGLLANADFQVAMQKDPNGVPEAIKQKFAQSYDQDAMKLSIEPEQMQAMLKGQLFAVALTEGKVVDITAVRLPGILDDQYAYDGELGVQFNEGAPKLALWAPTAQSVKLHLFSGPDTEENNVVEMTEQNGVWSVQGDSSWVNQYYTYEVTVYHYLTDKVETYRVTDPYSVNLSQNSRRSQIVNLYDWDNPALVPEQFAELEKPVLHKPEDAVIYEMHVRDFSISDETVPETHRGTYRAFSDAESNGVKHLQSLAEAGLTHVHLLPMFDIASVNEDPSQREEPVGLSAEGTAKYDDTNKTILADYANTDGFNWGYDPLHFGAPEGSYATNANGLSRIYEVRQMVSSLSDMGLRTIMDVVYNHTAASGLSDKSVLDKVVPGYYHRRNIWGVIENSTCCENTASEHHMMEKLMVDTLVTWAKAYKMDGFRFDLMGHHMKRNMQHIRDALNALTIEKDGVDGKSIYLYGEGWDFGEVAGGRLGENATQFNMGGTGIGSYNDRLRDAVRGDCCGSLSQLKSQGFINGLSYDDNGAAAQGRTTYAEKEWLLKGMADDIRVSLAGNLKDYHYTDRNDQRITGFETKWSKNDETAVAYTNDPQENILYVSKHDNQTLWDISQYKHPTDLSMYDRVRAHNVGMSLFMLGQGVPFLQAGAEALRSKSLTRDSYNAGDWFNKLDWTFTSNNWAVGQPVEQYPEAGVMDFASSILETVPEASELDIKAGVNHFRELLRVRKSSPLFHLSDKEQVNRRVKFHNVGPNQQAGVIVMSITDGVCAGADLDANYDEIVVVINARHVDITFDMLGADVLELHPVMADDIDADAEVQKSTFEAGVLSVPKRTTAVFVQRQGETRRWGQCNDVPTTVDTMFLRGTFNEWGAAAMTFTEGQWRYIGYFPEAGLFKFDVSGNFAVNFGDNEPDGKADSFGENIAHEAGLLLFSFDYDSADKHYSAVVLNEQNDFDQDGLLDIFEAKYGLDPFTDNADEDPDQDGYTNLEEMNANTDPTDSNSVPSVCSVDSYHYHDFNCDGKSDLLWRDQATGMTYMYLMDGIHGYRAKYVANVAPVWQLAAIGDFDGDHKADIMWRNTETGANYMYLMNANLRKATYPLNTQSDMNWQVLGAGDMDNDGDSDIVWRNAETGEVSVYWMQHGKIDTVQVVDTRDAAEWTLAGIADMDGDGLDEMVWRSGISGEVIISPVIDGAAQPARVRYVDDQNWQIAQVTDLDGDHKADLVWRNQATGFNYLYFMDGATVVKAVGLNQVPNGWQPAVQGDFNGDGMSDLMWRHETTGLNYIYLMNGQHRLQHGVMNQVPAGWNVF